jgi:hypothetical protein
LCRLRLAGAAPFPLGRRLALVYLAEERATARTALGQPGLLALARAMLRKTREFRSMMVAWQFLVWTRGFTLAL